MSAGKASSEAEHLHFDSMKCLPLLLSSKGLGFTVWIAAGTGPYVAVLGDVVASRRHPDRDRRLAAIGGALDLANGRVPATQSLTPTIGDEFQGLYVDLVSALDATLVVRLALLGEVDVRFGIGSGELLGYETSRAPFEQDGPSWWTAREAVDMVRDLEQRRERPRGLRTRWIDGAGPRRRHWSEP